MVLSGRVRYNTKNFHFSENCQDGDVRLETDGSPFLFSNNKWSPICGHYFWNNNDGATAFCKKLGYPSGTLEIIRQTYSEDSIRVGECRAGEDLMACTGGCNEYETGNGCAKCTQNQGVSVSIACADQGDIYSSCEQGSQRHAHYQY